MLVPLLRFPCPSKPQVGQVSGTALPLTNSVAGTQGHSVTTKLKLRVGRGETFQCLLLGTLAHKLGPVL